MPKITRPLPPQDYLLERFTYDPETGIVRYTGVGRRTRKFGDIAGREKSSGELTVKLDGKIWQLHRLIWRMHTGEDPGEAEIDHKDLNKKNNRWENLRKATASQQQFNKRARVDNKLGVRGVVFRNGKYRAQYKHQGKVHHIGVFLTIEEAARAYNEAVKPIHGEFWRES